VYLTSQRERKISVSVQVPFSLEQNASEDKRGDLRPSGDSP
jgi:hypothetical protein